MYAREFSTHRPLLDANNINLIGVGFDEVGADDFIKGKFLDADLYIDNKKEAYNNLDFKRENKSSVAGAIFSIDGMRTGLKAKKEKAAWNFKGDLYQDGGMLIVTAGAKEVLLNFRQEKPSHHIPIPEVLKILKLDSDLPTNAESVDTTNVPNNECNNECDEKL